MAVELEELPFDDFVDRLKTSVGADVRHELEASPAISARCFDHYCELRRWAARASLIGPGTAKEVVERHFGESLAALPSLPKSGCLVDIGSGGGFPGLVLACARPILRVTLVEPRSRKVAFLRAAARRAGADCKVLADSVDESLPSDLPERIDCLTLRALKLSEAAWQLLAARLSGDATILLWAGVDLPELPATLEPIGESRLPGSDVRRLVRARPVRRASGSNRSE